MHSFHLCDASQEQERKSTAFDRHACSCNAPCTPPAIHAASVSRLFLPARPPAIASHARAALLRKATTFPSLPSFIFPESPPLPYQLTPPPSHPILPSPHHPFFSGHTYIVHTQTHTHTHVHPKLSRIQLENFPHAFPRGFCGLRGERGEGRGRGSHLVHASFVVASTATLRRSAKVAATSSILHPSRSFALQKWETCFLYSCLFSNCKRRFHFSFSSPFIGATFVSYRCTTVWGEKKKKNYRKKVVENVR